MTFTHFCFSCREAKFSPAACFMPQIKMAEDVKGPMVLWGSWCPQKCFFPLSHPGLLKWGWKLKCFRAHQRPLWNQSVRIPEVCKFCGSHFLCWLKYTANPTLWILFPHSNTNQHILHPNSQTFTFISQELQSEGKIHHTPIFVSSLHSKGCPIRQKSPQNNNLAALRGKTIKKAREVSNWAQCAATGRAAPRQKPAARQKTKELPQLNRKQREAWLLCKHKHTNVNVFIHKNTHTISQVKTWHATHSGPQEAPRREPRLHTYSIICTGAEA